MPSHTPAEAVPHLRAQVERWAGSTLGERQAFHSWFNEFCDALGVGRPGPEHGQEYCFEKSLARPRDDGDGKGFIDCWKASHVDAAAIFWPVPD